MCVAYYAGFVLLILIIRQMIVVEVEHYYHPVQLLSSPGNEDMAALFERIKAEVDADAKTRSLPLKNRLAIARIRYNREVDDVNKQLQEDEQYWKW